MTGHVAGCRSDDGEYDQECPACMVALAEQQADALASYQTEGRYALAAGRALDDAQARGVDVSDPGNVNRVLKGRL